MDWNWSNVRDLLNWSNCKFCTVWSWKKIVFTFEVPSSSCLTMFAGLIQLLTNLLRCSKCLVISVANTMSITCCRIVRKSSLKFILISVFLSCWSKINNGINIKCNKCKYPAGNTYLSRFLKILIRSSFCVILKETAAWWLSKTALQDFKKKVLWLLKPVYEHTLFIKWTV